MRISSTPRSYEVKLTQEEVDILAAVLGAVEFSKQDTKLQAVVEAMHEDFLAFECDVDYYDVDGTVTLFDKTGGE